VPTAAIDAGDSLAPQHGAQGRETGASGRAVPPDTREIRDAGSTGARAAGAGPRSSLDVLDAPRPPAEAPLLPPAWIDAGDLGDDVPVETEELFSQRAIYDARYRRSGYDRRSAVRVLLAEERALRSSVFRALTANRGCGTCSVIDFGYGTGRVTNEFLLDYPRFFGNLAPSLRVVAYDVSSAGLKIAAETLAGQGFEGHGKLLWNPIAPVGYVAGSMSKVVDGVELRVVFVHGNEGQAPAQVRDLLVHANEGSPGLVTTSWYSGVGHVAGEQEREAYFTELANVTHENGELILAVAATGDLRDAQAEWRKRLDIDAVDDSLPIQMEGDVVYRTELGQLNFWHVFGLDLIKHMTAIDDSRSWWLQAIRMPGDEFRSRTDEWANYTAVLDFNRRAPLQFWTPHDFAEVHTVAAFRSGSMT
jgi:hypothetical protein